MVLYVSCFQHFLTITLFPLMSISFRNLFFVANCCSSCFSSFCAGDRILLAETAYSSEEAATTKTRNTNSEPQSSSSPWMRVVLFNILRDVLVIIFLESVFKFIFKLVCDHIQVNCLRFIMSV